MAAKGVKQISKVTSGEKRTLVTRCVIVGLAGNHLPPAMIFPGAHFKEHMIAGAHPGTLGLGTVSGWMYSELFLKGVTVVTFPSHSTNKLQPLDVGVFKPFSLTYNAAVDTWLMHLYQFMKLPYA